MLVERNNFIDMRHLSGFLVYIENMLEEDFLSL